MPRFERKTTHIHGGATSTLSLVQQAAVAPTYIGAILVLASLRYAERKSRDSMYTMVGRATLAARAGNRSTATELKQASSRWLIVHFLARSLREHGEAAVDEKQVAAADALDVGFESWNEAAFWLTFWLREQTTIRMVALPEGTLAGHATPASQPLVPRRPRINKGTLRNLGDAYANSRAAPAPAGDEDKQHEPVKLLHDEFCAAFDHFNARGTFPASMGAKTRKKVEADASVLIAESFTSVPVDNRLALLMGHLLLLLPGLMGRSQHSMDFFAEQALRRVFDAALKHHVDTHLRSADDKQIARIVQWLHGHLLASVRSGLDLGQPILLIAPDRSRTLRKRNRLDLAALVGREVERVRAEIGAAVRSEDRWTRLPDIRRDIARRVRDGILDDERSARARLVQLGRRLASFSTREVRAAVRRLPNGLRIRSIGKLEGVAARFEASSLRYLDSLHAPLGNTAACLFAEESIDLHTWLAGAEIALEKAPFDLKRVLEFTPAPVTDCLLRVLADTRADGPQATQAAFPVEDWTARGDLQPATNGHQFSMALGAALPASVVGSIAGIKKDSVWLVGVDLPDDRGTQEAHLAAREKLEHITDILWFVEAPRHAMALGTSAIINRHGQSSVSTLARSASARTVLRHRSLSEDDGRSLCATLETIQARASHPKTASLAARIGRAIGFYRQSRSSDYTHDRYLYLWLALESVFANLQSDLPRQIGETVAYRAAVLLGPHDDFNGLTHGRFRWTVAMELLILYKIRCSVVHEGTRNSQVDSELVQRFDSYVRDTLLAVAHAVLRDGLERTDDFLAWVEDTWPAGDVITS